MKLRDGVVLAPRVSVAKRLFALLLVAATLPAVIAVGSPKAGADTLTVEAKDLDCSYFGPTYAPDGASVTLTIDTPSNVPAGGDIYVGSTMNITWVFSKPANQAAGLTRVPDKMSSEFGAPGGTKIVGMTASATPDNYPGLGTVGASVTFGDHYGVVDVDANSGPAAGTSDGFGLTVSMTVLVVDPVVANITNSIYMSGYTNFTTDDFDSPCNGDYDDLWPTFTPKVARLAVSKDVPTGYYEEDTLFAMRLDCTNPATEPQYFEVSEFTSPVLIDMPVVPSASTTAAAGPTSPTCSITEAPTEPFAYLDPVTVPALSLSNPQATGPEAAMTITNTLADGTDQAGPTTETVTVAAECITAITATDLESAVTAGDGDVDVAGGATYTIVAPGAQNGTASLSGSVVSYTPDANADGFTELFYVEVTDSNDLTALIPVKITVAPCDDGAAAVDTDGDGVPDWVEEIQGTDPDDATDVDKTTDTDGDGVPDWQEILDGTAPENATDGGATALVCGASTVQAGGTLAVTLPGYLPGTTYAVEINPTIASGTVPAGAKFTTTAVIPADLAAGTYTVTATGTGLDGSKRVLTCPNAVVVSAAVTTSTSSSSTTSTTAARGTTTGGTTTGGTTTGGTTTGRTGVNGTSGPGGVYDDGGSVTGGSRVVTTGSVQGVSAANGSQVSSGTGSVVTNSASPRTVAFTGSSTEILTGAGGLMLLLGAILLARKVRES
jgi:hypothetical protein